MRVPEAGRLGEIIGGRDSTSVGSLDPGYFGEVETRDEEGRVAGRLGVEFSTWEIPRIQISK